MLHDQTPGAADALKEGKVVGYIGFDPTAPSMTIGNLVQLMVLKLFQMSGHQPIVLMGGATGRIGDPSGKDEERKLKSFEELDKNLESQAIQARKLLDFDKGDNRAIMVNNMDFYKNMNVLDFLRDVGKNLTVNYMLSKESVKKRLEIGISYTEFSYQLLQAYDFLCLYRDFDCTMQMGGSDQWGNITAGTEFIRRNLDGAQAHAITSKLITKADGKKFGKSEKGNIWLDPDLTSPYQFYQFWINADDRDVPNLTRFFTLESEATILEREKTYTDNPNQLKRLLAEELTTRIHSLESLKNVERVSRMLFDHKLKRDVLQSMDAESLKMLAAEIPAFHLDKSILQGGVNVTDLLSEYTGIFNSKGEVRRSIKGNALGVNKSKIANHEQVLNGEELLHDRYLLVENGKKNKFIVIAE